MRAKTFALALLAGSLVAPVRGSAQTLNGALAGAGTSRVRESTDRQTLRAASVALLPLSLAGSGERIAVPEVPALRATAAVAAGAAARERAEQFVRFLGSEAGQRAFAACGGAAPR